MHVERRWSAALLAAGLAAASLTACSASEDKVPSIGYSFDNVVNNYNARTVDGAASGARQAFTRVQVGFSYLGPDGDALSDNDIGTVAVVPGDVLTLQYTIAPAAKYSDGAPMACDDLVLAWAANSGRFATDRPLFDAASTAGYSDISSIDCVPGSKDATVVFAPGRSYQNWRALFGATDLLPAHVAARAAGVPNVVDPIVAGDDGVVSRIADFWNTGWTLTPGSVDTSLLPSAGPYRVDSYTAEDGLVLVANDAWWGIPPETQRVVIWPKGTDVPAKINDGSLDVIDQGAGANDLGSTEGFETVTEPSRGVEQLTFATQGALAEASARRAVAACIPRTDLFDTLGHPGFEAPPAGPGSSVVDSRLMQPDTLVYPSVAATVGDRYQRSDLDRAGKELAASGSSALTVRVGYLAPDARRAQLVSRMATDCAAAGITVEDASSPEFTPSALRAGAVDAVLGGAGSLPGPTGSASSVVARYSLRTGIGLNVGGYSNGRIDSIVDQLAVTDDPERVLALATEGENILWNDMPSLPLYSEPRTTVVSDGMQDVVANPTAAGAGWNMDRWVLLK
ncbi:ABC transporter substrate-binding protein [Rhodococcus sp. Leaf233]|uniref:ABC transporter substrate-binding protein n=1 Tax=Rhodococcus sp. Leaf233 TaxID=1736302 RepID=UPI00070F95B3|nr:peptide-binding protein [Rhodococcus sp. Leaf233]MBY4211067.1 peptide-binding protein [Rhodococcus fascians]MBY4236296.1 peptide-binding protein [Rhodococcus fascians]MBY4252337.1 peptide-binding protein [Rhodococcus fascians]MBY4267642.1 peptide-binding protein [Rhodococcus fascians]